MYSVITIGGTSIATGMTLEAAEALRARKCEESEAPHYYVVRKDDEAKEIAIGLARQDAEALVEAEASKDEWRAELDACINSKPTVTSKDDWQNDPRFGFVES